MKVVHVPFTYYPDPVGGTEVYVASLARNLQRRGVENVVAAPASLNKEEQYEYEGSKVRRFPVTNESRDMLSELYGEGDPDAAARFGAILDEEQPDVVHMHAFTRGVSLLTAREVKRRGIKLVFTYHTPTVSCQRGTLLRNGLDLCDGVLDRSICTRCTLQGHGVNGLRGKLLSAMPTAVGHAIGALHLEGGMWTALRMTELVELRQNSFRSLMQEADAVIALCRWTKELLLKNHVPAAKITVSRHGLMKRIAHHNSDDIPAKQPPLRIAFLGRLDRTKGPDVLIRAIRSQPALCLKLDLYGIPQGTDNNDYVSELRSLAASDQRITFYPPVPNDDVITLLRRYHVLAAPSRWLETGPLVVLEAFAAGIPVIGSNLGGISELVKHGVDGLLVEPDAVEAWALAITKLCSDTGLLPALCGGVKEPRDMAAVAREMFGCYQNHVQQPLYQVGT